MRPHRRELKVDTSAVPPSQGRQAIVLAPLITVLTAIFLLPQVPEATTILSAHGKPDAQRLHRAPRLGRQDVIVRFILRYVLVEALVALPPQEPQLEIDDDQ